MAEASNTRTTSTIDLNLDQPLPEYTATDFGSPDIADSYEGTDFGSPDIASAYSALDIQDTGPTADQQAAKEATDVFSQDIQKLRDVNAAYLRGEISGDVAEQVRAQAAETALAGGVGTQSGAARSLQARDFGLTSMQIQQQGMAQQTQIGELQSGLSSILENRSQFGQQIEMDRMRLEEQSRQFSASYGLDAAQTKLAYATASEQSRQFGAQYGLDAAQTSLAYATATEQSNQFSATLALDAIQTQIARSDLLLRQDMFNKEQNLKMIGLITDLASQQASLQVTAAMGDKKFDMGPVNKIFDDLMSGIRNTMGMSNRELPTGGSSAPVAGRPTSFTPAQLTSFNKGQIGRIKPNELSFITPDAISGLTNNQVKGFTKAQMGSFTVEQLQAFTPDQLKQFTKQEILALSTWQLAALSETQLKAIEKYFK